MKINKKRMISIVLAVILFAGLSFVFINKPNNLESRQTNIEQTSLISQTIDNQNLRQATFKSETISCAGCTAGIKYLVEESLGVVEVTTSFQEKTYTVVYDPKITSPKEIIKASGKEDSIIVEDKEI